MRKKQSSIVVFCFIAVVFLLFIQRTAFASRSKYFDFGPYYNKPYVLGVSLSVLENLPAITIPKEIVPPKATGILPGNPLHGLETFAENIQLGFTFDPVKKEELRLNFAEERVAEAKTLLEEGKTEAAKEAMYEYDNHISTLTDNISHLSPEQKKSPENLTLINKAEEAAASHAILAQSLSTKSSPVYAETWNQAEESSRKLLDTVSDIKGEPAVPEELKTDIQKLKEFGIVSEEESNKLYSYKTRSELRSELEKLSSSGQFPLSELAKLDTGIAKRYKESYDQQLSNLEVVELKTYQTLAQPSQDILADLETWKEDTSVPPPNNIRPYLWYNHAQDLAKEVDLSNFSSDQQAQVGKFYPQAVTENKTYSPPPVPSATPSPTPPPVPSGPTPSVSPTSPSVSPSPQPSVTPVSAAPYIGETAGAIPGDPAYFFKQFGEQARFAFTFDPAQKARLKMQEADRRLAEARKLAYDTKKASLYEASLTRYRETIVDASRYLKNISNPQEAKDAAEQMESLAGRHEIVLEKGLLPPPANKTTIIGDMILSAEDAMDISADKLDKPAIPPALSQRLDDLKAQGLILPEEANDLVISSTRQQAREKIRKLVDLETFPLADAKKLDEAQTLTSTSDYNQLVEVRKIEELQKLRAAQAGFAQTPSLKANAQTLSQREIILTSSIDTSVIKPGDLAGREDLLKVYQTISKNVKPINSGQFGPDVKPGVTPSVTPTPTGTAAPRSSDAVLTTCPIGATFKQFEGCVWEDGKKINDYDQYKCGGPRQYYSFAVKKCIAWEPGKGFGVDAGPICPVGYAWSWQTQSCQTSPLVVPTPTAQPEAINEKERKEREKQCPEGSTYKFPDGCVWDKDGKSVLDPKRYDCPRGQYYSFEKLDCVPSPKEGQPYPKDAGITCKESNAVWSWPEGACRPITEPQPLAQTKDFEVPRPFLVAPDSPFYFVKQLGETIQLATALTPKAKEEVRIAQAKERLAEGYDAIIKKDETQFKESLSEYTTKMQELFNDLSKSSLSSEDKKNVGQHLSKQVVEQNLLLQNISAVASDAQEISINSAVSTTVLGVDKAADLSGEPPIPAYVKEKLEALPKGMIPEEEKKKLLKTSSRVEARLKLGSLVSDGVLTQTDTAFLNDDFEKADINAKIKTEELKKLEEITTVTKQKDEIEKRVEKNEKIVKQLDEFEKTFEVGKEVPADIRPYVRLTRINEIAQTIRPDIVKLEDFSNRRDVILAVATLQEEFKPTKQAFQQLADFRRRNPGASLPYDLARIEALSYSLGVRDQASACYLPPPFPAYTPCPAPGAAIPIVSYFGPEAVIAGEFRPGWPGSTGPSGPSVDKDGKPFIYGQGPKAESFGVCAEGFHWMYDSGGWCMSNSGSYTSSGSNTAYGGPVGSGYTPYSPYYNAPGVPPASYGYQDPGSYPTYTTGGSPYPYPPPSYYGVAPTNYTTDPPIGTVPGTGPAPTASGQCPSGFHWMPPSYNQAGWCMADSGTYVPGGPTPTGPYSPNLNQSSCGPGYYWDGRGCIRTSPTDTYGSCSPPGGGCGYNSYWDYGSCSCRSSSIYTGGGNPTSGNSCQGISCGGGSYLDYSTCSCRYSPSGPTGPSGIVTSPNCFPPAGGCGSGWFDSGSCSCKQASSQGCYNVSASSCGSGFYWDSSACTCRSSSSTSTSTGSSGSTSTSSSTGSCPSGYHWMSDNGGWCMSDGSSSSSTSPPPSTTTTTTTESSPPPSTTTTTTTESSPPPSTTETTAPPPAQTTSP
ncbi:MAG: hypothetical protein A3A47_00685 [Candidatus Levybacteria bacterium RIFCSPLOWO2_01_FULL_37_20]|nr:MAG: hypothetical protein A3A47_00685 [Candidatus Levybacteria bacterium RIFCSPLOWO2_01_FULL_37_20]